MYDTLGCDSIITVFYGSGAVFFQMHFANGVQNGWYEQFHKNGVIWVKQLYVKGKVTDGLNMYYHDNGIIFSEGYFKNGHKIGKWYGYNDLGEKDGFEIYKRNGKLKIKKKMGF